MLSKESKIFSLNQVMTSIARTLSKRYTSAYWIKAEMNKLNYYKHSGHAYPELIEKEEGKLTAQIRATLWKEDYEKINRNFLKILSEPLKDGIKILFLAKINFDSVHGVSLRIIDIDPEYTLGDLTREKQETIKRLERENIFNRNQQLIFPLLPQRIAIISVETSKGYIDFFKILEENKQFSFFHVLFPSLLQGEKAVESIIRQLKKIKKVKEHFDIVVIIRGGGGDTGLSCYNNYELAKEIALFPLPVITGIGHATNLTVSEMLAYKNGITPTKTAEILVQYFNLYLHTITQLEIKIIEKSKGFINYQKDLLYDKIKLFNRQTDFIVKENKKNISILSQILANRSQIIFSQQLNQLLNIQQFINKDSNYIIKNSHNEIRFIYQSLSKELSYLIENQMKFLKEKEKDIENMNPKRVLERGYSISRKNGKAIQKLEDLQDKDIIETEIAEGIFTSIAKINSKNQE